MLKFFPNSSQSKVEHVKKQLRTAITLCRSFTSKINTITNVINRPIQGRTYRLAAARLSAAHHVLASHDDRDRRTLNRRRSVVLGVRENRQQMRPEVRIGEGRDFWDVATGHLEIDRVV